MRSFLEVARRGNITDASHVLGLTQSALSRRIQQLEEDLGGELFERSRKGVILNATGRLVLEEGKELLRRYERLRERVGTHLRLEEGVVRLGGGATAVSFLVPPAISEFSESFPKVRFLLREEGSRQVERDVASGRLDLGIVTLPVHSKEFLVHPLKSDAIVLVAAASHPLAVRKRILPQHLEGQSLVGFEGGSAIRELIDQGLRGAGIDMNVVMELRSIPAILQMVKRTRNVSFVSRLSVRADDEAIKILPTRGLGIERTLAVIHHRARPLSPAADAFAQILMNRRHDES